MALSDLKQIEPKGATESLVDDVKKCIAKEFSKERTMDGELARNEAAASISAYLED